MSSGGVKYLGEFLVCQNENCTNPIDMYHSEHFKKVHVDYSNNKASVHQSISFDESPKYINYLNIVRIQNIVTKKIVQSLKGFNTNLQAVVQTSLYASDIFRDIFNGNAQSISEYFYLRSLQKGVEMGLVFGFSQQLCVSLSIPQEMKLIKLYKELCSYSAQWQNLMNEFNLASGINSNYLERFIQRQANYFVSYCQSLAQKGQGLVISDYLNLRKTSTDYQNDVFYYSPQFTSFLTQKYQKNPSEQQIFTVIEYYLNFWQYFYVLIDSSKNVQKYFEEEVGFYGQYQQYMLERGLNESFLSYRMWRINHKTSTIFASLKNPFFLQTYIYSYIQQLIQNKLFYAEQKRNYSFKQFAKYLKDYVKFVLDKQEAFNFVRYREYFDFRRKHQKLQESLEKNKEIVYDRKHFVEYAHNEFVEGNKLAIKKYKKYQQKSKEEEDQKQRNYRTKIYSLKTQLMEQEKEHFYQIVFANFIKSLEENDVTPSIQLYHQYKEQLLKKVDETYIQQEEAKYRKTLAQFQPKYTQKGAQDKKQIVKEEIDEAEQEIVQINQEEADSSASSEEEQLVAEICLCCRGNPYNCPASDCQVMGCCTACMLD